MEAGCEVDALSMSCDHVSRFDLAKLSRDGCADVPLIHLPLVCRCGVRRSQIVVPALNSGFSKVEFWEPKLWLRVSHQQKANGVHHFRLADGRP